MTATVAGIHLGLDTHANRPAANTVPDGSIYSCSTHSLIYKSNLAGNSWATWATLGSFSDPMTTRGDIIIRDASNVTARLAIGSNGKVLQSNGTDISWQTPSAGGVTFATQGTTSAGASFTTTRGTYAKKITIASACLIPSLVVFIKGNGSNYIGYTANIFADNAGAPGNLIAVQAHGTDIANAIVTGTAKLSTTVRALTLPIGYIAAAGDIWIAVHIEDNSGSISSLAFNSGTGGDYSRAIAGNAPVDSSITAFSSTSNDWCIYANTVR